MELKFCDLCHEPVPPADLDANRAVRVGDRVVCQTCDQAMGGVERRQAANGGRAPARSSKNEGTSSTERSGASGSSPSRTTVSSKASPRAGVGVAVALALASAALTLVAVIFLLVRGEKAARDWRSRFDETAAELAEIRERDLGTREYMVARAGEVTEEVLHGELERLATLQRQVDELRQAIFTSPPPDAATPAVPSTELDAGLLTAGDAMERISELEDQLLFLQARLFDLGEAQDASTSRTPGAAPPAEPPAGDLGTLVERLGHEDPIERVTALFALATVDDPGIVRHVIERLEKDRDRYIRALAARILERLEARSAVPSLISALEDPESTVRECAVSALRVITDQQFLFDPLGTREDRLRVVVKWRGWWKENWKEFLYEED